MTDIQTQILKATIQNRNDNESVSRDMFEVIKQVSKDWADFLENGEYAFDSGFEIIFETFISQYNP